MRKAFEQLFEPAAPAPEPAGTGRGGGLLIGGLITVALLALLTAYVLRPSPKTPEISLVAPAPQPAPKTPLPEAKPVPAPVPKPVPPAKPEPKVEAPLVPKPAPNPEPPPAPKPPAPAPPKAEPRPAPVATVPLPAHLEIHADPWAGSRPGTWFRLRTRSATGDSFTDFGMKEVGPGYRILISQTAREGRIEAEQFIWTEPLKLKWAGDAARQLPGNTIVCDVVEIAGSPAGRHILREGRHRGVALAADAELLRLDSETIDVKNRAFLCSVTDLQPKGRRESVRTWTSLQFRYTALRRVEGDTVTEVVDFGEDWGKRPSFPLPPKPAPVAKLDPPAPPPAPKVEPKPAPPVVPVPVPVPAPPPKPAPAPPPPPPAPKPEAGPERYKKAIAEAVDLLRRAVPNYEELSDNDGNLPKDETARKEMFNKAEQTRLQLLGAWSLYKSARQDAPDPALIDRRMEELQDFLKPLEQLIGRLRQGSR